MIPIYHYLLNLSTPTLASPSHFSLSSDFPSASIEYVKYLSMNKISLSKMKVLL